MDYSRKIIEKFGGIRKAARRLGLPASTVQYWDDSGSIPDKHKPAVWRAATEDKLGLTPEDFSPVPFVNAAGGPEAATEGSEGGR